MMSVWRCSSAESRKRRAKPRGLALGSVSGMSFRPVEDEKRARMGVLGFVKWGAEERDAALRVGVKVPRRRRPLACAGRIF